MDFKFSRAFSIAEKEVMHIMRDPFTLALALGLPVLLVTFFGFAIDFEIKGITLCVADGDHSRPSRQLAEIFNSSGYFNTAAPSDPGNPLKDLDSGAASAVMFIKPGFSQKLIGGREAPVQFALDGTDNSKAMTVLGYLPGIQKAAYAKMTGVKVPEALKLKTRFMYNPELNSRWFTIPGLAVIVIGLLCILLTALTVAREWENGSMELLLSTPVRPAEIVLGKIAPYIIIVLTGVAFVYLMARLGFGVPFRGSHLLFLFACMLFIVASLSQGLLISVLTRQQQVSMQFSMITGLLPSMLLSGFIFPVESMPGFFQYFTMLLAPRWFMTVARSIFLKGSSFTELLLPFGALAALAVILLALSGAKFKTDLEP